MDSLQARISSRFQQEICKVCIYETADGGCDLQNRNLQCPIMTRVDPIIAVIGQIDSDQMDPYIEKLREVICSDCEMQDQQGKCKMREHSDCALDDYFGLVVQIVDEELQREARA